MIRFTLRRTVQAIPLLLLVTIVSFAVMQLTPGGPLTAYEHNPHMTAAQLKNIEHDLGLDLPPYVQYFKWLSGIVHGDWGASLSTGESVLSMIGDHIGNTLVLVLAAFLISIILAIPLGIYSAVRKYSVFDYIFTFGSFVAWSAPVFWVGFMAQLLFSVKLRWLPTAGLYTEGATWTLGDFLRHLILPALVLGLGSIATWSRYLRGAMVETLSRDYVRTAKAKGLAASVVVNRHAVRNALIPLVTVMALDVPTYFTGALLVEIVFSWPGMGRLFFDALNARDYILLQGILLISAALIFVGNLLADLVYGWLDPRIQYS
jgi:peptide/nickel transport system permease protein